MVVVETLSAGRPVIASKLGGITDLVEDGVNGLLVSPGDTTDLVRAMQGMLAGDVAERLAASARGSSTRFGSELIAARFEAAYERACRGAARRAESARDA